MTAAAASAGVAPELLRSAMGRFATGVSVVTAHDRDGEPVGTTANSLTSLSLDPPLLLVCFARESLTLAAVRAGGAFAVNVLGAHQSRLSSAFARRGSRAAWGGVSHARGATGAPRLGDALATLDCTVERILDGGDHDIVIGRVHEAALGEPDRAPLVFFGGAYTHLEPPAAPPPAVEPGTACDLPTRRGAFRAMAQETCPDGSVLVALLHGDPREAPRPEVAVHGGCMLGDTFGSVLCGCRADLDAAMDRIVAAGAGVLVYVRRGWASPWVCGREHTVDAGAVERLLAAVGLPRGALAA
jgi:flavin reductase (DIM6/NTAB) family NADH-FMN oxidoreductase RutF